LSIGSNAFIKTWALNIRLVLDVKICKTGVLL
jgi:hypothetical protein